MLINFGFWVWSIDDLSVSSQFSDALDRDMIVWEIRKAFNFH